MKYTKFTFILGAVLAIAGVIAFATMSQPKSDGAGIEAGATILSDTKTIDIGAEGMKEEAIEFTVGATVERNYVFVADSFVNPVRFFGVGLSNPDLTAGQIKNFTGQMIIIKPNGQTVAAYHTEGSLQWTTAYAQPPVPDLRGCTCKVTLTLNKGKNVILVTKFTAGF